MHHAYISQLCFSSRLLIYGRWVVSCIKWFTEKHLLRISIWSRNYKQSSILHIRFNFHTYLTKLLSMLYNFACDDRQNHDLKSWVKTGSSTLTIFFILTTPKLTSHNITSFKYLLIRMFYCVLFKPNVLSDVFQ